MMPMGTGLVVSDESELMMDINTTPLIDVLLVLLVMLIITIPIQLHAIDTRVPITARATPNIVPPVAPQQIEIAIDAADRISWQGVEVAPATLASRMAALAQQDVQPDVLVRPDRHCSYAVFAHVLAESRRQGLSRLAVVGSEQFH